MALHRARAAGLEVRFLLTMFDETGERSRSHGLPAWAMDEQAAQLGLTLIRPEASWADYETVFVAALRDLAGRGVDTMVFGDIDLQPHRDWEEKVCAAAGMRADLPLWQGDRDALAHEVISLGFVPFVICTDDRYLPADFCGRRYDRDFLADLPPGVDLCGENGEFHTFVSDGPGFAAPVDATIAAVVARTIRFGDVAYGYHYAMLGRGGQGVLDASGRPVELEQAAGG